MELQKDGKISYVYLLTLLLALCRPTPPHNNAAYLPKMRVMPQEALGMNRRRPRGREEGLFSAQKGILQTLNRK